MMAGVQSKGEKSQPASFQQTSSGETYYFSDIQSNTTYIYIFLTLQKL